jgi:hypothetical protein
VTAPDLPDYTPCGVRADSAHHPCRFPSCAAPCARLPAPDLPDADLDRLAHVAYAESWGIPVSAEEWRRVAPDSHAGWCRIVAAVLAAAQDEAAVERAARAMAEADGWAWDDTPASTKQQWRDYTRAGLAAAWGTT